MTDPLSLRPDLAVAIESDSLRAIRLDYVIAGSIGAVEAPRAIRALRRLGADVFPWVTKGGARFATRDAVEWAANSPANYEFSGLVSHVGERNGLVIAPMSASLLGKISSGITDSPASALAHSYLGQGKPICAVLNMHQSIYDSPVVQENKKKMSRWVDFLPPRMGEGKAKFPNPDDLADLVSHRFAKLRLKRKLRVLVTLGSVVAHIDEVRYLGSRSTGRLGSLIAQELYRQGCETIVVHGIAQFLPAHASAFRPGVRFEEMLAHMSAIKNEDLDAGVFCASVCDFLPEQPSSGKIPSTETLELRLKPAPKIIELVKVPLKVGFKMEGAVDPEKAREIAERYLPSYGLTMICINGVHDVSIERHDSYIFEKLPGGKMSDCRKVSGKRDIARTVVDHILTS